jgi:GntR family transcriptional regulator
VPGNCYTVPVHWNSEPSLFHGIDPRSPIPLYVQIADRVRLAIATGTLGSAAPLPSVRQLAAELRINPATVIQAYRDLEAQGFVEIRHGAGTFVRELAPGRRARERAQQAVALVRKLVADARRSGVSLAELQRALETELGVKAT